MAESAAPGDGGALLGRGGGDNGVVADKTEPLAVGRRRQLVAGPQVAAERLERLAADQADEMVALHRLAHRHRGLRPGRRLERTAEPTQLLGDDAYETADVGNRNAVVAAASVVGREMLDAAEADAGSLAMAHRVLGTCAFFTGEFELAARDLDDAAAHLATSPVKPTASQYVFDPAISMAVFSSLTLLALGQLTRAEALQVQARSLAEAGDHMATTAFAHHHGCFFAIASARPDVVQTLAAEMLQLAERERLSIWLATGRIYQGWSVAFTSQDEDAVRIIDEGLARWRATGARLWLPVYLALRADALVALRREREAAVSLAQARDLATETPDRHFVSEIHRRMAVVHLATGDRDAAERALVLAA